MNASAKPGKKFEAFNWPGDLVVMSDAPRALVGVNTATEAVGFPVSGWASGDAGARNSEELSQPCGCRQRASIRGATHETDS